MSKRMLMALLALAMVTGMGSLAHAQSIGFSFGGGGYGHHHHHCPPSYYFGFSSPPPVYVYPRYVAPPPVTYVYPYAAAPQVIAPAPVAAAPAPATANTWKTRTEPRANTLPVSERQVAIIRNPSTSGGAVAFVVDEEDEVALDVGQSHALASNGNHTVEFDRGGEFGTSRKTIGPGVHEFVVTERGWDLVNQKDRVLTATKPSVKSNALPTIR